MQRVVDALIALSRAARSVLLYDAGNATVQQHLSEYQARMQAALAACGDLAIVVAPFQLLVGTEVVYSDTDREKSLAFRLFRDGVRGLRIAAATPWEELLGLLEIIAVRYTGVRQQEDDAVTLLRKAEFRAIAVDYVEGFTPSEELPEPAFDPGVERQTHHAPPPTWDTPLPALPQPGPLEHRAVPDEALAPLRALDRDDAIAELAVSAAGDLLRESLRGDRLARDRDVAAFFDDVRDGLLVEGSLRALRGVFDLLVQSGATQLRDRMLEALAQPETVELVLASIPEGCADLTADAAAFAPLLGGPALLDALVAVEPGPRRTHVSQLVKARLPGDVEPLLARFPQLAPPVIADLVGAIAARAPDRVPDLAQKLLAESGDELRLSGLALLEYAPPPVPLRRVCELLRGGSEPVRVRACEVLARRGDERVLDALREALEAGNDLSEAEVEALGRALGQVAPARAAALFAEWLHPKKRLIGGITAPQRVRQLAAVAGTGVLPGAEAEQALQKLADDGDGDLRRHCLRTLARRRGRDRVAR